MVLVLFFFLWLLVLVSLRLLTDKRAYMKSRVHAVHHSPKVPGGKVLVNDPTPQSPDRLGSAVRRLANTIAGSWAKQQASDRLERIQSRLQQAGIPGSFTIAEWIGIRILITALGGAAGILLLLVSNCGLTGLCFLLCFTLGGWIGSDFWLSRRITIRQATILKQLPNALDLLTVSVEAGLGFDQALAKVSEKMHGPLAEEFERCLREIQLGSQRASALQRLGARTGVDAVRSFVSSVVQADRLGLGLAQVLRIQSNEVRRQRKMDAQERAMKAPIKMLFPLVMFVFPALFIVILGPAVIHIMGMFHS